MWVRITPQLRAALDASPYLRLSDTPAAQRLPNLAAPPGHPAAAEPAEAEAAAAAGASPGGGGGAGGAGADGQMLQLPQGFGPVGGKPLTLRVRLGGLRWPL